MKTKLVTSAFRSWAPWFRDRATIREVASWGGLLNGGLLDQRFRDLDQMHNPYNPYNQRPPKFDC